MLFTEQITSKETSILWLVLATTKHEKDNRAPEAAQIQVATTMTTVGNDSASSTAHYGRNSYRKTDSFTGNIISCELQQKS